MKKNIFIGVMGFLAGFCLGSYKMYCGLAAKEPTEEFEDDEDYSVDVNL